MSKNQDELMPDASSDEVRGEGRVTAVLRGPEGSKVPLRAASREKGSLDLVVVDLRLLERMPPRRGARDETRADEAESEEEMDEREDDAERDAERGEGRSMILGAWKVAALKGAALADGARGLRTGRGEDESDGAEGFSFDASNVVVATLVRVKVGFLKPPGEADSEPLARFANMLGSTFSESSDSV